jgi:O-antigen ligase
MISKYISAFKEKFFFIDYLIFGIIFAIILGNSIINIFNFFIFIFYVFLMFNSTLIKNYKNFYKVFFLISLFFFLNILFSINKLHSSITYIAFLGHFVLMLSIIFFINIDKYFKINLSKILFYLIIFVSLDTIIQYFTGTDIFGYEISTSHGVRLSGPFGDEYVVGAFLSKLFFLSILFLDYKKFRYYNIFLILVILVIIILSNERSASVMFLFASFLYFIFNNFFSIKEKIIKIFLLSLIIISLFNLNPQLKDHFIDRTFEQIGVTKTNHNTHNNFWDSQWGAHYLTSFEIFKDNPVLGSGADTFRYVCSKEDYSNINSAEASVRCNTHPHNIYIEILSELGIIGFLFFVCFLSYIFIKLLKNFYSFNKKSNEDLIYIISFIILFNPIQTTGSFFSTWNGIFYWILLGYIFGSFKNYLKANSYK